MHAMTMKQVQLREETLNKQHKAELQALEDRFRDLQNKFEDKAAEVADLSSQILTLKEKDRLQERNINKLQSDLTISRDKAEQLQANLTEITTEHEITKKELSLKR